MFENLLHQDQLRRSLIELVEARQVPQAMLFHGPSYAGKLTAALELARVVSCRETGAPWSCTCNSCNQQRFLLSPYLMMAGRRYHGREIRASAASLGLRDQEPTRFLFLRSVRKLLRRFDPVLWEGDPKLSQALKLIDELEGRMEVLLPGTPVLDPADLAKLLDKVVPLCDSLQALLPKEGLNVNMVRHLAWWAHTADAQYPKVIILESADAMNEACRNSLLKILEEPPPDVYFILACTHRQSIMPTILSRVRPFGFANRGGKEAEVVTRIFRRDPPVAQSLHEFFLGYSPLAQAGGLEVIPALEGLLLRRAGLAFLAEQDAPASLSQVLNLLPSDRQDLLDVILLLSHRLVRTCSRLDQVPLAGKIATRGMESVAVLDSLQGLVRLVRSGLQDMISYNISGSTVVERVYSHAGDGPCAVLYKEH